MIVTLSWIEVINQKKATEKAIAKLLSDLQTETGLEVEALSLVHLIGYQGNDILTVSIETKFDV